MAVLETLTPVAVDQLNSLLRSEIAASETYEKAIRKIERNQDQDAIALRVILNSHKSYSDRLKHEIRRLGGDPDESHGAWGVWANTVENVASLFGDASAIKALKEGERHSVNKATEALQELDGSAAMLVKETILPALSRHLDLLELLSKPL